MKKSTFVTSRDTAAHILAITSARLWSSATEALHLVAVSNFSYRAFKSIYFRSLCFSLRDHL